MNPLDYKNWRECVLELQLELLSVVPEDNVSTSNQKAQYEQNKKVLAKYEDEVKVLQDRLNSLGPMDFGKRRIPIEIKAKVEQGINPLKAEIAEFEKQNQEEGKMVTLDLPKINELLRKIFEEFVAKDVVLKDKLSGYYAKCKDASEWTRQSHYRVLDFLVNYCTHELE